MIAPVQGLTRANLAQRTVVKLRDGGWESPDVLLVDSDDGPVVVKDFSPRRQLIAMSLGRWLIGRERRALEALSGHPSVPRLLGSIDSLALVLEHRGGVRFTRRRPWTFTPEFDRRLRAAVVGLHELGVVHLDLRHRSNIRADLDGRPVLIDFDSAVTFRSGSLAARWVKPLLAGFDLSCLRKFGSRDAGLRRTGSGARSIG
ncbi:MAG: hypothetical protein AAEJ52_03240 [Myxococcota bacterium]